MKPNYAKTLSIKILKLQRLFYLMTLLLYCGVNLYFASEAAAITPWTVSGQLSYPRSGHTVAALPDGRILVAGGENTSGLVAEAEVYNPATNSSQSAGSLNFPRKHHAAVTLQDGRILFTGGQGHNGVLNSVEVFNPGTGSFEVKGFLRQARKYHKATALEDGSILITGGNDGTSSLDSIEKFDPLTGVSETLPVFLASAREEHTATLLLDARVLIVAGRNQNGALSSSELFDPENSVMTLGPNLSETRYGHSATLMEKTGVVAIIGGTDGTAVRDSAEIFAWDDNIFFATANKLAQGRFNHSAVYLPHNRQLLVMGGRASNEALTSVEELDTYEWVFSAAGVLGNARAEFGAVAHDETVVVLGGNQNASLIVETANYHTLKSDMEDYPAFTDVQLSGANWQPGETVELRIEKITTDPDTSFPETILTAVADEAGNFQNSEFNTGGDSAGFTFFVTATGASSGQVAYLTFTDSHSLTSITPSAITQTSATVPVTINGTNFTPINLSSNIVRFFGPVSASVSPTSQSSTSLSVNLPSFLANAPGDYTCRVDQTLRFTDFFCHTHCFTDCGIFGCETTCFCHRHFFNFFRTHGSNLVPFRINAANSAPLAQDQSVTTDEDVAKGITLGATDVDADPLTFTVLSGPSNGSLSGTAPNLTYTPNANFNGSDSFTFKANDGTVDSNIATVDVTVSPVNDAPVATNDSYTTDEDVALNVGTPGVLGNDTDVEAASLTASVLTGPSHGTLALNPNGSFIYTPAPNYNGPDSFTYKANDGSLNSNIATVSITVNPVNDAPVAANDSYSVDEDTTLTVAASGVLSNDTDIDSPGLIAAFVSGPSNGTLTLNPNGSFSYTPAANYNGPDSFTYKTNDGSLDSNIATVNITVNSVNDAPVAQDQSVTTDEDVAKAIVLGATDAEGDSLTFTVLSGPSNGSLSGTAPNLTYTPNANFNGLDSFTFNANDGSESSNTATVNITVNPVNDPPLAANDSYSVDEDTTVNVAAPGVLGNDIDIDSAGLTAIVVIGPNHGTLTFHSNGSFSYTPAANYNGPDSFTYKANDGSLDSTVATVNITVNPVNDLPVANAGGPYSVNESGTVVLAGGGTDVDGDPLTFTWDLDNNGIFETLGQNPTFSAVGRDGPATQTVVLKVCDDDNACSTSPATVNILNVAPTASAGGPYNVNEGGTVALAGTGTDVAGDTLTFSWDLDNNGGFETLGQNPTFSAVGRDGPATQTVVLKVCDDDNACSTSNATVNIVNVAPVVGAVTVSPEPSNEGSAVTASASFSDAGGADGPFTCTVDYGDGSVAGTVAGNTCTGPAHTYPDNGSPVVTIAVTDKDNGSGNNSATHTVNNVPPVINSIVGPADPIALANTATVTTNFGDVGVEDSHTCTFSWDDSSPDTVVNTAAGVGWCSAPHYYNNPGVYTVVVTVTDKDGGSVSDIFEFVVVYDPSGGFVTGGGFIDSPAGAYVADPELVGKANFGFVSKYKKGATVPEGQTEFQFKVANLNFHSSQYKWLIVSGPKAQFKGVGTINGQYGSAGYDGYGFLLTATDSAQNGGGHVDKFRIKIWDVYTETVVYDNVIEAPDDMDTADPQEISGGSIVIHTPKGNK